MPKVEGTLLSAGCSGSWYFDWISERTNHTSRHIGLEFYSPKPDSLPGNVEWIANTVGDMSGVKDGECELVFSGQNLEHLWPEDVAGFFLESYRVLKDAGWIIVDSPNRLITEAIGWSHPEHTVEYTPAEASQIIELSGFDVVAVKGIWLCQEPGGDRQLSFDPNAVEPAWTVTERCLEAVDHPDHSFIWWIEAKKSGRMPDADKVHRFAQNTYQKYWPERTRRFSSQIGTRSEIDGKTFFTARKDESGALIYGPYMPLVAGRYQAKFEIRTKGTTGSVAIVRCDVLGDKGREIAVLNLTEKEIAAANGIVTLPFELDQLEFGIQTRCIALGKADIECHPWPVTKA